MERLRYEKISFLGEGQFATVYKARDMKTNEVVAVKKIKVGSRAEAKDGINRTALREIKLLQELNHKNLITLRDVFGHRSNISLVFDFMDTDLEVIVKDTSIVLTPANIKAYIIMTLEGLEYLHMNWILHRDLKPNNLLVNAKGILKIGDFGLAKFFGSPTRIYTHQVVTRWYRAPELLFGARMYAVGVDMWAVGCILTELLLRVPFLPDESEISNMRRMFRAPELLFGARMYAVGVDMWAIDCILAELLLRVPFLPGELMISNMRRMFRAPELLFGARMYAVGVDMWAVGCILAELLLRVPFLPDESEISNMRRMFRAPELLFGARMYAVGVDMWAVGCILAELLLRVPSLPGELMISNMRRMFRAPELLFGARMYAVGVDMWAVGCILAELLLRVPFLPGESDLDQLTKIFQALGTPSEETWPGVTSLTDYIQFKAFPGTPLNHIFTAAGDDLLDLIAGLLSLNPLNRLTCSEALQMPYFSNKPAPSMGHQLPLPSNVVNQESQRPSLKRKLADKTDGGVQPKKLMFDTTF